MKKKLVAVAIAGAFALPMAAQAQTANVTMYGRINVDMELVSGKQQNGSDPHVFRVSSNSSRWGIRGSESLGGGLNAIFQLESSINWDAGGGTLAGRETFVGLQGGWGTFKMGNFLVPYDDVHPIFMNPPQVGWGSGILSTAAIWGQNSNNGGLLGPGTGGFDVRVPNSVRYESPNIAGFNGAIQYGTFEGTAGNGGAVSNASITSIGLFYNNGPIQVGTAYNHNEDARAPGLDDHAWTIAAAYDFGIVRPALVYEAVKYDTPTGDLKRDFWGGSVTVPLGAGLVYAFWGHANDGKGASAQRIGGLVSGPDSGANQYEIAYGYAMSKRTNLYAGYVRINNECRASYSFHINPYGIGNPGGCFGKPQGFVLGMTHVF